MRVKVFTDLDLGDIGQKSCKVTAEIVRDRETGFVLDELKVIADLYGHELDVTDDLSISAVKDIHEELFDRAFELMAERSA